MNNWKETTLGEIGRVITGKTPSMNNPEYWGDFLDFITPTDIKTDFKYLQNINRGLSNSGAVAFRRMVVPKKSVIVTCIGSDMGKVIVNKEDCVTNQQINSLIVSNNFNTDFIYYLLKNSYKTLRLNAEGGGSTMPIINKSTFASLSFLFPPLPEQKEIAGVLGSLDDKIELLRKENETLEKIAQTIFKEWFVDFTINGEKLKLENGIPEGWRVENLSTIANITIGRTPPRKEDEWFSLDKKDIKWISIKDMGNCGVYIGETSEYLTREAVKKFNIPVILRNTVILSFKMTVGRVSITMEDMLSNEAIAHIKLKDDNIDNIKPEYIYLFLKTFNFSNLGSTSSIVDATNSTTIKKMPILLPNGNIVIDFNLAIKPIFEKILNNSNEIKTLSVSRDTLLPKLMSGEVLIK